MTGWETLLTGLTTPELASMNNDTLLRIGWGIVGYENRVGSFDFDNVRYHDVDDHDRDRLVAAVALYEIETRLPDMSPVNRAAVVAAGLAVLTPGSVCGRA